MMASWRANLARWRQAADTLVGINRRNLMLVYPHNERRHYQYGDDKLLAKEALSAAGVPVPDTLAVCRGLFAVESTLAELRRHDEFVIKPVRGSQGKGILVVVGRTGPAEWQGAGGAPLGVEELRRHLANIVFGAWSKTMEDEAIVEPRLVASEKLQAICSEGLPDLRVIVLRGRALMAMLRVPTKRSKGKANLHQGGIGLGIDLRTGRVTHAAQQGRSISHHPDTGSALVGLEVPDWERALDAAALAAQAIPLGYMGVDVVFDRHRGPLVLEVNVRPGLEIQNVSRQGLRPMTVEGLQ
jgi:alpha-L-glutamate ligase-like protein